MTLLDKLNAFIGKLQAWPDSLHDDLHELKEAIRETSESQENDRNVEPVWVDKVLTQYKQTEKNKSTTQDGHNSTQNKIQNSIRWATWSAVAAASIYAAITAYMACQSRRAADYAETQAGLAKQSFDEAHQNFLADQRAWMGAKSFIIDGYPKPFRAVIQFVNSGKTPALNIAQATEIAILNAPLLPRLPITSKDYVFINGGDTAPQGEFNIIIPDDERGSKRSIGDGLTADDPLIQAKQKFVYIQGEFRYDDIFGCHHAAAFCFYMSDPKRHILSYCAEGNTMIDEKPCHGNQG